MPVGSRPLDTVPIDAARGLLLAGCGLDRAPVRATPARVLSTVRALGFVQVDSINSVERAHHLILHARLDGYEPQQLAHHTEKSRALFEHWTHDASVIRSDWLPWWTHRFARSRTRLRESAWMRERLGRNWRRTIAGVRATIEERGPLATRDFPRPPRAGAGWWDWSPHKAALEYLWRTGEVAIHSRRGFEKVYELAERVHGPAPDMPARDALVEWACAEALDRLGAATPRELAQFMHAVTLSESRAWCARAVREGRVLAVRLERIGQQPREGVARTDWERVAGRVRVDDTPRLLAPFDPLIRDRDRLAGLFGFDYRFEAFVPAAKRVHGYYTMPVLVGNRLVARVDLASDRHSRTLRVDRFWAETGRSARLARSETRRSAARLADQLGLRLDFPAK